MTSPSRQPEAHVDFFAMEGYSFGPDAKRHQRRGLRQPLPEFRHERETELLVRVRLQCLESGGDAEGEQEIAHQARQHEMNYREALENGARALRPGVCRRYRISEKSDFGIVNPDGTCG